MGVKTIPAREMRDRLLAKLKGNQAMKPGDYAAGEVRDLLRRINVHLAETVPGVVDHGETSEALLSEAADLLDSFAIFIGLWGAPRTVSRPDPAAGPKNAAQRAQDRARDAVTDATVAAISAAMVFADSTPAPADPDPSPDNGGGDFSGGGGESGGGGASGSTE